METRHLITDFDRCYRAICSRDARFDGQFFTAVTTTGIYCRPICPAPTPYAFPVADLGLRRAFAQQEVGANPHSIEKRAEAWRPWRAYAAHHLWASLSSSLPMKPDKRVRLSRVETSMITDTIPGKDWELSQETAPTS